MTGEQQGEPSAPLRLLDHHRVILCAMSETEARRTGSVAEQAGLADGDGAEVRRIASANCRRWLLEMEAAGLVRRIDDPAAWLRTPSGTAVLGILR